MSKNPETPGRLEQSLLEQTAPWRTAPGTDSACSSSSKSRTRADPEAAAAPDPQTGRQPAAASGLNNHPAEPHGPHRPENTTNSSTYQPSGTELKLLFYQIFEAIYI